MIVEFTWHSLEETNQWGRRLGELLFPNAVVALVGGLGAGKTHLSRAIAEGLLVRNPNAVTSPTFVLIQEYPARLPIFHMDVYRLLSVHEYFELGALEYYTQGGVCLIEWADRVREALPLERLEISLQPITEQARLVRVVAMGEQYTQLLRELAVPLVNQSFLTSPVGTSTD
jgi:tRNA threonylcarbamoyladenosine biosynthesis protein TsaE